MIKKLEKWFDLTFGWFFVNGMKRKQWDRYLKEKYGSKN